MAPSPLFQKAVAWLLVGAGTYVSMTACQRGPRPSTHKTTFQVTASREFYAEADESVRPMKMVDKLNREQMRARSERGYPYYIARFDKERRLLAVEQKVGSETKLRVDYDYGEKQIRELRWVPRPPGAKSAAK